MQRSLKRKREQSDDEKPAKKAKVRTPKQLNAAMKKSVKAEDLDAFKEIVKESIAAIDRRGVGYMASPHLVKKSLKSSRLLHFFTTLEGFLEAIRLNQWDMVNFVLDAVLKLRHEEVSAGDTYFPSVLPFVTLAHLRIHLVTRLIQLREIDFESLRGFVHQYEVDLTQPDLFFSENDPELAEMKGRSLFENCNPELMEVEHFNPFISFMVSEKIPLPNNAVNLRVEALVARNGGHQPEMAPGVTAARVAEFITHARSLNLSLDLTNLYQAEGMTGHAITRLEEQGFDIPWRHYSPSTLAKKGLLGKYSAVQTTPEQDREAIKDLLADFDVADHACFDMLAYLLDRTNDFIFEAMQLFQSNIKDPMKIGRVLSTLEKMLTILRNQYPDEKEFVKRLLRLIENQFTNKKFPSLFPLESSYLKLLWEAISTTKNYNHAEFIARIYEFYSSSQKRKTKGLSHFFILQPGKKVAGEAVRQLVREHRDMRWMEGFLFLLSQSNSSEMDFNLLEDYLVWFVRDAKPDTQEPIKGFRAMMNLRCYSSSLKTRTITDNDEKMTIYDFVMRHQDRLPQFATVLKEETRYDQTTTSSLLANLGLGFPKPVQRQAPVPRTRRTTLVPLEQTLLQGVPAQGRRIRREKLSSAQPMQAVGIHSSVSESATKLMVRYFPNVETRQSDLDSFADDFLFYLKDKISQAFEARLKNRYELSHPPEVVKVLIDERMRDFPVLIKEFSQLLEVLPDVYEGVASEDASQAYTFLCRMKKISFVDPKSSVTLFESFLLAVRELYDSDDIERKSMLFIKQMVRLKSEYVASDEAGKPAVLSNIFSANIEFLSGKNPSEDIEEKNEEEMEVPIAFLPVQRSSLHSQSLFAVAAEPLPVPAAPPKEEYMYLDEMESDDHFLSFNTPS